MSTRMVDSASTLLANVVRVAAGVGQVRVSCFHAAIRPLRCTARIRRSAASIRSGEATRRPRRHAARSRGGGGPDNRREFDTGEQRAAVVADLGVGDTHDLTRQLMVRPLR